MRSDYNAPWHMRKGAFARAFARPPRNPVALLSMLRRGWRRFNEGWWSKPSPNQAHLERSGWERPEYPDLCRAPDACESDGSNASPYSIDMRTRTLFDQFSALHGKGVVHE